MSWLIMISGNWFIFIIIGLIVYLLATVFFRPKQPRNRFGTLSFLDRMRQTKELNRIIYLILKICFYILMVILAGSAVRYCNG